MVLGENSTFLKALQFFKSICIVFFFTSQVSWEWMLLTKVSVRSSRSSTRMGRSTLMPIGPATLVKVVTSSSAWSVARRGKKTAQQSRGTWQRGIMGQETERINYNFGAMWENERLGLSNSNLSHSKQQKLIFYSIIILFSTVQSEINSLDSQKKKDNKSHSFKKQLDHGRLNIFDLLQWTCSIRVVLFRNQTTLVQLFFLFTKTSQFIRVTLFRNQTTLILQYVLLN